MATKNKVTSKQVAQFAGVSQTTVSFVLNNVQTANISADTRQKVLQAAQELGYVPDTAARALARGRSNNVALILAYPHQQVFIDEYIPNILTGLSEVTRQNNFRILVEMIEDAANPDAYTDLVRGKEVAGMVVNLGRPTDIDLHKLVQSVDSGFPLVTLDFYHPKLNSVLVDKFGGVRTVVEHLVKLGHRRIGCITFAPVPENDHAYQRLLVYKEVLKEAGLDYDERWIRQGAFDPDTGYRAMKSLLEEPVLPTAVYAMNDVMAFGAIRAIKERGLRIPQDIAVVGFDNIRLAAYTDPALTTVYEPDIDHGRQAALMLMKLIHNQPLEHEHIVLKTQLIIRDSCGYRLKHDEGENG